MGSDEKEKYQVALDPCHSGAVTDESDREGDMNMKRIVFILGLLVLTTTGVAQAQDREGFWVGFGVGGGSLGIDGGTDRTTGVVGYVKLGGTLSDKFLLGMESNAWTKDESGARVTHTNFSAVAYFYPSASNGFFLKGGIGASRLSVGVGDLSVAENGGGAVFGLGYDARIGDNWSITPVLNFNGGVFAGGNSNLSEFGVGVTWH